MKKSKFKEFMVSNLRMITENNYSEIAKYVNSTILQLFWRIGTILENDIDKKNDIDYHKDFLNHVSDKLSPLFGGYMHTDQLTFMKKFAEKYDSEGMDKVFYFPDWSEISSLLHNIPEDDSSMLAVEDFKSGINPYYSNIIYVYFSGKDRTKFRKLFEPKEDLIISAYNLPIQIFDLDVANKILYEIFCAQVHINHKINLDFNTLLWNIGDGIIKSSSYFEENISNNTIDHCIKELNESFPTIFNKKQLSACIKLVKHYPESDKFQNISDTVSWPFLKVLIEINSIEKHTYIANQLLTKEIDLSTVKKNISKGLLDKIPDGYFPPIENNYKLVKVKTEKDGQNYLIGHHYERINQNHEYQRILNCNIFKNKDLLEFMKKSVPYQKM